MSIVTASSNLELNAVTNAGQEIFEYSSGNNAFGTLDLISLKSWVSFFSIRPKYLNSDYAKFGWPLSLPDEGLSWTTKNTDEDFDRLTNFLVFGNDKDWSQIRNNTLKDLVFYNHQNYIYKNFLIEQGICTENDLTD